MGTFSARTCPASPEQGNCHSGPALQTHCRQCREGSHRPSSGVAELASTESGRLGTDGFQGRPSHKRSPTTEALSPFPGMDVMVSHPAKATCVIFPGFPWMFRRTNPTAEFF